MAMTRARASVLLWVLCLAAGHAASVQYAYDSLNRLARVTYADGTIIAYAYDAAGNRLSQVISNPAITQQTLSFWAAPHFWVVLVQVFNARDTVSLPVPHPATRIFGAPS